MSDVTKQFQIFCATQRTYSNVVKHTQAIRSRFIFDCNWLALRVTGVGFEIHHRGVFDREFVDYDAPSVTNWSSWLNNDI